MRILIGNKENNDIILIEVQVCDVCYDAKEKQLYMLSSPNRIGVLVENVKPKQAREMTNKLLKDGFLDISNYDAHPMHLDDDDDEDEDDELHELLDSGVETNIDEWMQEVLLDVLTEAMALQGNGAIQVNNACQFLGLCFSIAEDLSEAFDEKDNEYTATMKTTTEAEMTAAFPSGKE